MANRRQFLGLAVGIAPLAYFVLARGADAEAAAQSEAGAMAHSGAAAAVGHEDAFHLSDEEWRRRLSPAQYRILREQGTEPAYSSPLNSEHRAGIFACAGCALPLFSSKTKFESHTGWPSFWKPLDNAVETRADNSFGMMRTEVRCRRCEGHLGHVFDDGPRPTGLRYCMNGLALQFKPDQA
ncbi:MAG TPA: peptide-methionine (R)-S-oxide reductase MsrB [Eoetvoesiella sp.]|uniref:peptide-methionine (R)-S-oxide reductase MsrB n=1 Tax=Eoetvoesiella sp. TaxID=1966355 RepID=UPI002C4E8C02|nr:peptide-methionine (R)-S-oxide reductase MsrB [Eoetvoesiella sp.]HWK61570.1 peptide-methionine (R)-S-oxide reductase MsrB [Eoetvoesiella sp.]